MRPSFGTQRREVNGCPRAHELLLLTSLILESYPWLSCPPMLGVKSAGLVSSLNEA